MLRQPSSRKGFSLIEVLMGAMILVVSFIALIQAITMGSEMMDNARKQQIAQQIIDSEISHLRLSQWGSGPVAPPPTLPPIPLTISAPASAYPFRIAVSQDGSVATGDTLYFELDANPVLLSKAGGFTITLVATDVPGRTGFRQFVYTVTWKSNTGRSYSRAGMAYLGKNGLQLSYQKN